MKKAILIIATMLAVFMLLIACAPKAAQPAAQPAAKPTVTAQADDEPELTPEQELEREQEEQILIDQANADEEEPEAPAATNKASSVAISQDDLDDLKADLEGMEFEDLGGLSEE